ncbi:hypothetical protein M0813_01614 [Anaeramoeba flamelloides]|uniref:Uncharacterized protein n=1 Tax=Anaeramoeba flamelloides TaxID=1746091 RepID=A0ABQ8Z4X5_9EUKA|nr:hypothetical protein M0813_01614 [Anaeramoeba flamelloides]
MNTQFEDPLILLQCCYALLKLGSQTQSPLLKYDHDFIRVEQDHKKCTLLNSLIKTTSLKLKKSSSERPNNGGEDRKQMPVVSEGELALFLNMRPKPSWGKRLEKLYLYNPDYIIGWYPNLSKRYDATNPKLKKQLPKKIIINKTIFTKCANLTATTQSQKDLTKSYKSAQRGIEEYFKRNNYKRLGRYNREKVEFALNEN